MSEDLKSQDIFKINPSLYEQVSKKISEIQGKLKSVNQEMKNKDKEIWFLEAVLNQKD